MDHTTRILLALFLCATSVFSQDTTDLSLRNLNPFTGIVSNATNAFTGWNAALQLGAIAITPILVNSGADRVTHNWLVQNQTLEPATIPAVWGTYLLPATLTGGLYAYGRMKDSPRAVAAACAVSQATAMSFAYQSILKSVTGRPGPKARAMSQDEVAEFPFGFMEGGIHYGWPSGHMMTTTSILVSLQTIYPESRTLKWGGAAWVTYVFGSVLMHEQSHMHHLSDAVAGTLMGYAIGRSVGAGFSQRIGIHEQTSNVRIDPVIGTASGAVVKVTF
ncbi:MAG: hypothetical protein RL318_915 [Fibrobacterota bacterium]|jgi:membrane-associated phospholipid phosphatase